ncbi:pro-pol polyprotein [Plakobranchus ocellatus]|uniref:Pro-pol polyprotein n=1 Tax=Plakobranchus ocellatus TaxID=259542 RepID=A0AAV4AQ76_9GAST|nr:pro-pol polyprotein [Plakobranchus ocellatus]
MEESGIIKEVKEELPLSGPVFYLPHKPVVREDSKTTKVRPVFDASAKGHNGVSLNDCLEAGPNLLPNLLEVLTRFRRWKVAVIADIKKAFLQIKVKKEVQNVLRFSGTIMAKPDKWSLIGFPLVQSQAPFF